MTERQSHMNKKPDSNITSYFSNEEVKWLIFIALKIQMKRWSSQGVLKI
jgi:hypothetical protein